VYPDDDSDDEEGLPDEEEGLGEVMYLTEDCMQWWGRW